MEGETMRKLSSVVAVLALVAGAGAVLAHEGHAHKIMGTVAALDAMHIEVDTADGKKESFLLAANTKYSTGKRAAVAADVKVGTRVVLTVGQKDGKKNVTEVLIGAGPKSGAPPHKH
jgi:hypothetical protein